MIGSGRMEGGANKKFNPYKTHYSIFPLFHHSMYEAKAHVFKNIL
jgi:hypothetical protein